MKWTPGRLKDRETIEFFMPKQCKGILIEDSDWQAFFDFSERGKKTKIQSMIELKNGYDCILAGKRWRDIHMNMWQEGVLDGTVPYMSLLGLYEGEKRKWWQFWKPKYANEPLPRSVVDFMKRDMFDGIDADIIEKCYQEINN